MTTSPLSDDELAAVQEEALAFTKQQRKQLRNTTHKVPMCRAAGPLIPWPWQRCIQQYVKDCRHQPVIDPHTWQSTVENTLAAIGDDDLDAAFQDLQQVPYHGNLATELTQTLLTRQDRVPTPLQAQQQLLLQELIALWQDYLVTYQLSVELQHERSKLLTELPLRPTLLRCKPVFLYIFSGRRRKDDFQFQVERFPQQAGKEGFVLLVDLALSTKHDVYKEELLLRFKSWITAGWVAGLLLAPPCETWSEARHVATEYRGPRPLRSAEDPFCLPQLTRAELEQLEISNHLLFVAVRLVLWATCHSVPTVTEHPREPKRCDRASIWRLPWFTRLLHEKLLVKHEVYQAKFGSLSAKPTNFASGFLPHFRRCLKRFERPVDWTQLQVLSGKDSSGAWMTSKAKEYPPDLNAGLAWCFVDAFTRRDTTECSSEEMTTFREDFFDLYAGDVDLDQQFIQPDFHLRHPNLSQLD
eukprot:Skav213073  [mRNA]  locus=scaffold4152:216705:218273:- [translate_table: standard]